VRSADSSTTGRIVNGQQGISMSGGVSSFVAQKACLDYDYDVRASWALRRSPVKTLVFRRTKHELLHG
jgi:hypothetical protein